MSEDKKQKIKFAVIGAGKIGNFHARTLASMPEAELVGVSDPDLMRAQKIAWENKCMAFAKYQDLIPQVNAVVVAVPTALHMEVTAYAMKKGVHCLVEKPIASTMEEAQELLKLSQTKETLLQVGHSERFNPAMVEAFRHIKNPRYINIQRLGPYDPRMSSIGVVLDLMIHDIDLLLTMIEAEPLDFDAVGASMLSSHEDIANVRLRFKNGTIADVTASRMSLERARFMRVYQDDAYISVDFMNARVKTYSKKTPVVKSLSDIAVSYPKLGKKMPIHAELEHFIECINQMKTPWPSAERGSKALALALQITNQLKRYEINKGVNPEPAGPIRIISDIGKATQVIIDETLQGLGRQS